jgi:triacylglycerol lipase
MLDSGSLNDRGACRVESHGDARSGRARAGGDLASVAALCAVLVGCGSVGEDPGTWGSGDVITGGGGGSAAPSTGAYSGDGGGGRGPLTSRRGPPYPIVLAHGFFGFEEFAGADFITYFYSLKSTLSEEGETVFTPSVDPFNNSTFRAVQLVAQIQEILDTTGYEKVNLIAHSQGGLDARVVAHDHPELVASVVTFATPHHGTKVADIALKLVSDPHMQSIVDDLGRLIGAPLYDAVGNETSVVESLRQLSGTGAEEFNATYTDSPGVFYASIGGRSDRAEGGADCMTLEEAAFVEPFDHDLDPVNPLLSLTETILDGGLGADPIPNDGLVRARDSRWGHFWGCVPADHLDEIGHLFGQGPGQGNSWNYIDFYRSLIERLRQEGF